MDNTQGIQNNRIWLRPVTAWHAKWIPFALSGIAVSIAAVFWIVCWIDLNHAGYLHPDFVRFVDLNEEMNLPTWFTALLWQVAALLAFCIAQKHREADLPHVAYWFGMIPLFLFLSLDESAKVHETIGNLIDRRADLPEVFLYTWAWVIFGVGLIAAVGILYLHLMVRLRPQLSALFIASAVIFIVGAVGIESVGAAYEQGKLDRLPLNQTWVRMITYEEMLEIFGIILLIYTLLRVQTIIGSPYRQ